MSQRFANHGALLPAIDTIERIGLAGRAMSNLVGLTERIAFLRRLEIDPKLQARVSSGRWDQMIRQGNATPARLANDFNAIRRHALIVARSSRTMR